MAKSNVLGIVKIIITDIIRSQALLSKEGPTTIERVL